MSRRSATVLIKASVSEAAEEELGRLAEPHGCYRSRYAGLLLEGMLEAFRRLRPLDRRLMESLLLGTGTAQQSAKEQRKRAIAALQHTLTPQPRQKRAQQGRIARPTRRLA